MNSFVLTRHWIFFYEIKMFLWYTGVLLKKKLLVILFCSYGAIICIFLYCIQFCRASITKQNVVRFIGYQIEGSASMSLLARRVLAMVVCKYLFIISFHIGLDLTRAHAVIVDWQILSGCWFISLNLSMSQPCTMKRSLPLEPSN